MVITEHGDSTAVVSQVSHSLVKTFPIVWQVESTSQWIVYRLDTLAPPEATGPMQLQKNHIQLFGRC